MRCSSKAVLAAFGLACIALSSTGFAKETAGPVRLVAPQRGTALAAGSTAELEWTPRAGFAGLQKAEEWEAFLSVDGGATYPVRLTPHLDADLRRFRFQVPPIPTANARLLLRFGDERRETAVELPERFTITAAPATMPEELLPRARLAFAAGEPALPGKAGVVSWVEGSRRGGELRQVVAADPPGLQARPELTTSRSEAAVLASGPAPSSPSGALSRNDPAGNPPACRPSPLGRAGSGPSLRYDILLLTQRQNE